MKTLFIFLGFAALVNCAGETVAMSQYQQLLDDYNEAVNVNNENVHRFNDYTAACEECSETLQKCITALDIVVDQCACNETSKEEKTLGL